MKGRLSPSREPSPGESKGLSSQCTCLAATEALGSPFPSLSSLSSLPSTGESGGNSAAAVSIGTSAIASAIASVIASAIASAILGVLGEGGRAVDGASIPEGRRVGDCGACGGGGVSLSVAICVGVGGFWVGLLGGVDRCIRGRESCLLTRRPPSAHASARENGTEEEVCTGGASEVTWIVGERAAEFKAALSPACWDGDGRAMNTSVLGTVTRSLGGKLRVITGDETGDDLRLRDLDLAADCPSSLSRAMAAAARDERAARPSPCRPRRARHSRSALAVSYAPAPPPPASPPPAPSSKSPTESSPVEPPSSRSMCVSSCCDSHCCACTFTKLSVRATGAAPSEGLGRAIGPPATRARQSD